LRLMWRRPDRCGRWHPGAAASAFRWDARALPPILL